MTWLGGDDPHDPDVSASQVAWLQQWGERATARVLDLGCGTGRAVIPLAAQGHDVLAVDRDETCLADCQQQLDHIGVTARLLQMDFLQRWSVDEAPFDLICCLGNTFMLVHELDLAVQLLAQCRQHLAADGSMLMDDLPGLFGSEVESGNWQTGLSEDGTMQFIWSDQPDVFTIRCGSKIDPDDWSIRDEDVQLRFWREESLRDVAEAAGLSAPMVQADGAILVMRSARAAGSH